MPKDQEVTEIISDKLQPLLEIAEGKQSIEVWNQYASDLIRRVIEVVHEASRPF